MRHYLGFVALIALSMPAILDRAHADDEVFITCERLKVINEAAWRDAVAAGDCKDDAAAPASTSSSEIIIIKKSKWTPIKPCGTNSYCGGGSGGGTKFQEELQALLIKESGSQGWWESQADAQTSEAFRADLEAFNAVLERDRQILEQQRISGAITPEQYNEYFQNYKGWFDVYDNTFGAYNGSRPTLGAQ